MSAPQESPARRALSLASALVLIALVALVARMRDGLAQPRGPESTAGWYSIDPDGLYHTRRVARALEEGLPVAGRDPYLAYAEPLGHPEGAAIPWPPYYDTLLAVTLGPFAPGDPELRRHWLERMVSSLPVVFGVLSALLAGALTWRLLRGDRDSAVRKACAVAAGVYAACGWGAVNYSRLGTGDHHAFVGMLFALLLTAFTLCCADDLARPRRAALWGLLCGLLTALLVGSWVAALAWVGLVQLALAWLLVRRARAELPGVASFGLAMHLGALALLTPAVLASPWIDEWPWMVVNLSWFHLAWLALGAAVFVPPLLLGRTRLAAGTRAARFYPLLVAGGLALLLGLLWISGSAPARGVAEGFAWVSRADAFMDSVRESAPLVGARAAPGDLVLALGWGVFLVPLAWLAVARRAFQRGEDLWVPLAVAAPALLTQALLQKRFSDMALWPVAVLLAWGGARLLARAPRMALLPLGLALALLAQGASVARLWNAGTRARPGAGGPTDALLGERTALEWIRTQPAAPDDPARAVLAHWDRGHTIEWAADRPSVATNFGSYVGAEGYAAPARFYLAQDPRLAEEQLRAREVRYVYAPISLPRYTASMCRIAGLPQAEFFGLDGAPTARWRRSMLARLISDGYVPLGPGDPPAGGPLDFLRLVHVSTRSNPGYPDQRTGLPRPAAFVWERVRGARLTCAGTPGQLLEVEIQLAFDAAAYPLTWRGRAEVAGEGYARLRVPYATDRPGGDGRVLGARWRLGERGGPLLLTERAVLDGGALVLE